MKKVFLISFLFSIILLPNLAQAGLVPCGLAEDDPNQEGDQTVDCTFCHFFVMINGIVRFIMFTLTPVVAVLMLVIGGGMFFFAGAKSSLLLRAKGVIWSVVIGLLIIFSAWIIVNTVLTKTGIVDPVEGRGLLNWHQIECPTQ